MSSFVLKILAIIAMLFDHTGYMVYEKISWMNIVGRLAFPIFAWQISIGADKTRNIKKYIFRLLICAIISQPFFCLYLSLMGGNTKAINVIFTLMLGAISIGIFKKKEEVGILSFIISAIIAMYFKMDYGAYGIIMIMIFYLFRNNKIMMVLLQICNCLIYVLLFKVKMQLWSLIAVFLVLLYNTKKGKEVKYLLYIVYPLQFALIYFLRMFFK